MPFSAFYGNMEVVARLRNMLARDRFPHAVILSGPPGAGKYTLAQMVAKTMNCLHPPAGELPDFCGQCSNCIRIGEADDLNSRWQEAVEARENMRDADKRETRLFVQTHPDVLVIPPDPPQNMIKVDQVRRVIATIYYRPGEGRRRVYIFTDSVFMKEAANSLLKVLEEPPDFATLFLLTCNPGQLLPTIRSRCISLQLAALPVGELESDLAANCGEWPPRQRALAARLAEGAVGRARNFDLESYAAARADALTILQTAIAGKDHSPLFKITETYRAGADGQEKTQRLLRALYSVLQDLTFLLSATPELVRNTDVLTDLKRLSAGVDLEWLMYAVQQLGEVESGMRRNLVRSLSLDAFAAALEKS
jgi:DNA polymerase III subunit delta'